MADVSAEQLSRTCGEEPGLLCRKALEWTGNETFAELVEWATDVPLRIVLIVVAAFVVSKLVRRGIKVSLRRMAQRREAGRAESIRRITPAPLLETEEAPVMRATAARRAAQRLDALASVLRGVASIVIWTIATFTILGELGIDLAPLLAGAGVVGLAIGFGAQSLIKDFLSGTFILIEDQFAAGDIVDLAEGSGIATGVVEQVGLRSTRLRAVDGTVWHVPNGEILKVGNMSQHWSRALLDIEVAYETDLARAREVIKRAADEVWHEMEGDVLEEPEVWGVEALGASGIAVRLVVKTRPSEQWSVMRVLRERIKNAFDAEGIEIPFPQQTTWVRHPDGEQAPADDEAAG